jgi:uncharacterized protein
MIRLSAFPAVGALRPAVGICLALVLAACGQAAPDKASPAKLSASTTPSRPAPAGYDFPAQIGRVVDAANVLPTPVEGSISARLAALETQSRHQVVVVTVPTLGGREIDDYARKLGDYWGVGRAGVNDGIVLLVAPKEREVRIAIGDGLAPMISDEKAKAIIERNMVPAFKRGDYPAGVTAGVEAIVHDLMPAGGATI